MQIVFGCIGVSGNIGCWVVFSRRSLKCFHHLMLCLAVFDSLYILMAILLFGVPAVYTEYSHNILGYGVSQKGGQFLVLVLFISIMHVFPKINPKEQIYKIVFNYHF